MNNKRKMKKKKESSTFLPAILSVKCFLLSSDRLSRRKAGGGWVQRLTPVILATWGTEANLSKKVHETPILKH
jgi:hypothetical protein